MGSARLKPLSPSLPFLLTAGASYIASCLKLLDYFDVSSAIDRKYGRFANRPYRSTSEWFMSC